MFSRTIPENVELLRESRPSRYICSRLTQRVKVAEFEGFNLFEKLAELAQTV